MKKDNILNRRNAVLSDDEAEKVAAESGKERDTKGQGGACAPKWKKEGI